MGKFVRTAGIVAVIVLLSAVVAAAVLLTALSLIRLSSAAFLQGFVPHLDSCGSPSPSAEKATSNRDNR